MKISTLIKLIKNIRKVADKILPCELQDKIIRALGKETYLSQVEFHIVDHCNLNCAHCNHFTPLAEEKIFKIEDILEDFKKLKKVFDNIGNIFILGGEPVLHPNLIDIFEPLRNLYPKSEIVVITNGILLHKQDEAFWNALQKYNIALSMTKYPLKVDYDGFLQKAKDLGIKTYFFSLNRDKMRKMDLDHKGRCNKQKAFNQCCEKRCHFLKEGKLYVCTPAPNIHFLNKYFNLNFKLTKKDYIDLDKVKSATKINRLFKQPIDFCRYCNDGEIAFDTYRVSKKELSEWVLEDSIK